MKFIEPYVAKWINTTLKISPIKLMDNELTVYRNEYTMDMLKLEEHLRSEFDYNEEKDGSIKDFLLKRFGENGLKIISKLLF